MLSVLQKILAISRKSYSGLARSQMSDMRDSPVIIIQVGLGAGPKFPQPTLLYLPLLNNTQKWIRIDQIKANNYTGKCQRLKTHEKVLEGSREYSIYLESSSGEYRG